MKLAILWLASLVGEGELGKRGSAMLDTGEVLRHDSRARPGGARVFDSEGNLLTIGEASQ
jgi:hypothetical protein